MSASHAAWSNRRMRVLWALILTIAATTTALLSGPERGGSNTAQTVTLQVWSGEKGVVRVRSGGSEEICRFEEERAERQDLCVLSYPHNTEVTLAAERAVGGDEFRAWSVPECGTGPCTIRLDDHRSVFATFARPQLLVVARGGGSVRSEPEGINCRSPSTTQTPGANCRAVFPAATVITLRATPDAGQSIRWGVGCEPEGGDEHNPTCVARAESHFVTVGFGRDPPGLLPFSVNVRFRVSKQGDGTGTVSDDRSIDCPATCAAKTAEYEYGRRVTLLAQAVGRSRFQGWVEPTASCATNATCRLPVGMPVTSIVARFVTPLVATLAPPTVTGSGARRTIRVRATVDRAATCQLRLLRRSRIVAQRSSRLRTGANVVSLRVPRRARAGRYRLVLVVRDPAGQSRTLSRPVNIRR